MAKRGAEEIKKDLNQLKQHLVQCKDELKVQMNLAKHEMRDEVQKLESSWDKFSLQLKGVLDGAEELTEDAAQSMESMAKSLLDKLKTLKEKASSKSHTDA